MLDATYPPPVAALLAAGDPRKLDAAPVRDDDTPSEIEFMRMPDPFRYVSWPDYQDRYGVGPEYIPDLIRMATDTNLLWAGQETAEVWAPLHSWRALGQLHATEAIEPLLGLFDPLEDDDWFNEDIPDVFGLIGPAAIPALAGFLADPSHTLFPYTTASNAIERIGRIHPEAHDAAAVALIAQLEQFAKNDESLNAYLISDLIDLKATEALPTVERAFAAERVDLSILGDWEEAQIAFGVKDTRDTPKRNWFMEWERVREERVAALVEAAAEAVADARHRNADKKAKNRKKMANKSRRQNRKRK